MVAHLYQVQSFSDAIDHIPVNLQRSHCLAQLAQIFVDLSSTDAPVRHHRIKASALAVQLPSKLIL